MSSAYYTLVSIKQKLYVTLWPWCKEVLGGLSSESEPYFYKSTVPALTHTVSHNLNSENIEYTVLVLDEILNIYKNDLVAVSEIDNNTLLIESNEAINIKLSVRNVNSFI